MNRLILIVISCIYTFLLPAQTMNIHQGSVVTVVPAGSAGEMRYVTGSMLQVGELLLPLSSIDSITFSNEAFRETLVRVEYVDAGAKVFIPYHLVNIVIPTVNGADVSITSTSASDPEIEYSLTGASLDGSFTQVGDYKCKLFLEEVSLTSQKGAAVSIQNGKRIDIILAAGTVNRFEDHANGEQKAAFFVKGHPEIEGSGTLLLKGNARHAFASNEYTLIKRTTGKVEVLSSVADGIHVQQYFKMNGGELVIANTLGDCLQAEITNTPTDALNGQVLITGGELTFSVSGEDVKGIKSDDLITISGGTLQITVSGNGSKGISSGTDLLVKKDDAETPYINIAATGGEWLDPSGIKENDSKCMGIKVTGNLTVKAGTIAIAATGNKSKGIKVDGNYYYSVFANVSPVPEVGGVMQVLPE